MSQQAHEGPPAALLFGGFELLRDGAPVRFRELLRCANLADGPG